eukprot:scaffold8550_cov267-Pinguiococcus_pyrenoidosus.AAC.4
MWESKFRPPNPDISLEARGWRRKTISTRLHDRALPAASPTVAHLAARHTPNSAGGGAQAWTQEPKCAEMSRDY